MSKSAIARKSRPGLKHEVNLRVRRPRTDDRRPRSRRVSIILFVWFSVTLALLGTAVITNLTLRAKLTQYQMDIELIKQQIEDEKKLAGKVELEIAQLKSPNRILKIAMEEIGMVKPGEVHYLKELKSNGVDVAKIDAGFDGHNESNNVDIPVNISRYEPDPGFYKFFESTLIFMFP
jgi:cell division protein FtsL